MALRKCNRSVVPVLAIAVIVVLTLCLNPAVASAQTSIGVYADASGTNCSLTDAGMGVINAYVVLRPGPEPSLGVAFAAPKPACFTATYMGDVMLPYTLVLGNSQTGVSITWSGPGRLGCMTDPVHALTIQYFGTGTTPSCCAYPVLPDPANGLVSVDCAFNEIPATGQVSFVNGDATCECYFYGPPAAPSNPSPPNGAVEIPVDVVLAWTCTDPDGDPLTYDVYFGTEPTPPLLASGVPEANYPLSQLSEGVVYYWRIVAHDGVAGTSSRTWRFTTVGYNRPPAVPSQPLPADGQTDVALLIALQWQCSDPDGDPLTYDVYFGTASPPPLVAANRSGLHYTPPQLNLLQSYVWKIVARDSHGVETPGPEWSFTTRDNLPPDAPHSPVPADNGSGDLTPILWWSCNDTDGDPLTYDVYFGGSSDPPLVASGLTEKHYEVPGTLEQGQYYWRVVAHDPGHETSGPVWSFNAYPFVPGLGEVGLYTDESGYWCELADNTPSTIVDLHVLVWSAGGASSVRFAAPKPDCFTGVWLNDVIPPGVSATGDSQTGITVDFGTCGTSMLQAVTIQYLAMGTTPNCCEYPVVGTPEIIVADCAGIDRQLAGRSAVVNALDECRCNFSVPVMFSKFGASVLDEGVSVEWELSGDEVASRYTLMRREGDATQSSTVTSGPLAGVTGSYLDATVEPGTTYHYELLVRTADGNEFRSPVATVTTNSVELTLGQNHPNPFNPTTVIPYVLPNGSTPVRVRLLIMDVSGAVVRTLVDENQAGGRREVVWDGRDDRGSPVSTGIYFSVLDADGKRRTRKMVLLK